jgi:hypothetical protein
MRPPRPTLAGSPTAMRSSGARPVTQGAGSSRVRRHAGAAYIATASRTIAMMSRGNIRQLLEQRQRLFKSRRSSVKEAGAPRKGT